MTMAAATLLTMYYSKSAGCKLRVQKMSSSTVVIIPVLSNFDYLVVASNSILTQVSILYRYYICLVFIKFENGTDQVTKAREF